MSNGSSPIDLDLRLVRYFLVVAEHGHFGRAAAALYVGQPSLSRNIRQLESQVGAVLLDRTPQGTRLTSAGEAFLPWARDLVLTATRGVAAARGAAWPERILLGYATNLVITPVVQVLRRRYPDAEIDTLHLAWNEPREALIEGRVDAVVARLPFPTEDLVVTPLYEEPRVLLLSTGHRLAKRAEVTFVDIADEPVPVFPDPEWNAFWRVDPRPDGCPAPGGPAVQTIEDSDEWVAAGKAVSFYPSGAVPHLVRPGCTTIRVEGLEPCTVVVAARADDDNELVAAFTRAARAELTEP